MWTILNKDSVQVWPHTDGQSSHLLCPYTVILPGQGIQFQMLRQVHGHQALYICPPLEQPVR